MSTSSANPETPAETPDAAADSSTSLPEEYGAFPPGTIVLAKLKSFPPWPAIVIPFDLIPEPILKSKPKKPAAAIASAASTPRGRSKRKSTVRKTEQVDSRLWCVRFLKDDNFMWATIKDISLLTTEQIQAALSSKKGKGIKLAYEMALNPPDLDEFIIYGSDGKPTAVDNEAGDEDFVDDEEMLDDDDDNDGDDDDNDDDLEEDDEEEDEVVESTKKRRKSGDRKSTKRQAKKPAAKGKGRGRKKTDEYEQENEESEHDPNSSGDEDWENDNIQDDPVAINVPTSKEIVDDLKKKTPIIKKVRHQFQSALLTPPNSTIDSKESKNLISMLDNLDSFETLPISLLRHYSLNKVLIDSLKKPELESKDFKKLKDRISKFVKHWFDVEVAVDERWGFGYQEPKEEPKTVIEETVNGESATPASNPAPVLETKEDIKQE